MAPLVVPDQPYSLQTRHFNRGGGGLWHRRSIARHQFDWQKNHRSRDISCRATSTTSCNLSWTGSDSWALSGTRPSSSRTRDRTRNVAADNRDDRAEDKQAGNTRDKADNGQ